MLRLYGCSIPCGECGTAFFTSGDPSVDQAANQQQGLSDEDDLISRIHGIQQGEDNRLTSGALETHNHRQEN